MEFGTQARLGGFVCARQALQAQHLLSRSSPERKAVSARGRLQGQKRAFPIRFGEVGHALLCDDKPQAVNHSMMRVMILASKACSSSIVGQAPHGR